MQFNEYAAEVMLQNSPFWYRDGYDICRFVVAPEAVADKNGRFNRELCAWGYEKRYTLDEEGLYTLNE